jgi:hypothetical protein
VTWLLTAFWPFYVLWDVIFARWLPWWLRYSSSVLYGVWLATRFTALQDATFYAFIVAYAVTRWLANKNRRDKRDMQKLEAEAERLTEVQQTAFQREATEAA